MWLFGKSKSDKKIDTILDVAVANLEETRYASKRLNDLMAKDGITLRVFIATGGDKRSKNGH